jgi:hypothetical protein
LLLVGLYPKKYYIAEVNLRRGSKMTEEQIILPKVRLKLEEGAKGEVKVTVSIDGDHEDELIPRLVSTFKRIKADMEAKE